MSKYQYTVKGTPYQEIDLKKELHSRLSDFIHFIELKEMKNRFIIEIEAEEKAFQKLEPELLKILTQLINIQSYVKREYENRPKQHNTDELTNREELHHQNIKKTIQFLNRGHVVAIKTSEGFHILCNATKTNAVKPLRTIVRQPTKPLPVIFKNILGIEKLILLSRKEKELLNTDTHPFVLAKKRNLHRLEKERYKSILLSPHINTLNRRIAVSLPPLPCYHELFSEITFPLVMVEAKDERDKLITQKEELIKIYGDVFKYIVDIHHGEITRPHHREFYQIIYGTPKRVVPPAPPETPQASMEVLLDLSESRIAEYRLAPIKILLDEKGQQQPKLSALSLLFAHLPLEEITALTLPFETVEIKKLYENWLNTINTIESNSFITLFDAIASLSNQLHEKSFETESLLLAEGHFEVCEEDLFDYQRENGKIKIDIISDYLYNNRLKHLASTLVNTISTIIVQTAKEKEQSVTLKGALFQFRDLTELTIEKLEDAGIDAFY